MTQEQITQLSRIGNTLMLISTKGEDTLIMSECIRAIQQMLQEANPQSAENDAVPVSTSVEPIA